MRKLYAFLLAASALMMTDVSAQTVLYTENFNSGGSSFQINTSDLSSGGPSNQWVINASYAGGSFFPNCLGTPLPIPANIVNTSDQPAGIVGNPQSSYMHIASNDGLMSGVTNSHFIAANGICNFTESYFAKMSASISTAGQTGVSLSFWWLCEGFSGSSFGEVYYSINSGASWNPIPSGPSEFSSQGTWNQQVITDAILDNQPSLLIGFRFQTIQSSDIAVDPGFGIDDFQITANATSTNSITTDNILLGPYCPGQAISVPFTANGTFNGGNVFTAQLSNSAGSFASPVMIGTLNGTTSGVINANIPLGTTVGTNYQIRVVGSSPNTTGSASIVLIEVAGAPTASISPTSSSTVCSGGTATLNFSGSAGTIQWSSSTNNVTFSPIGGAISAVYTTGPLTQTTYFQATVTSSCGTTTSQSWTVTLTNSVVIPLSYSPNTLNLCNGPVTVSVTGTFSNLTWSNGQTGTSAIVVSTPSTISVTGQAIGGCAAASQPLNFILTTPPTLTVTPVSPVTLCGPSATLTASAGFNTYSWSNGQSGAITSVTSAGTYVVTGTDVNGCIVTSTPVQVVSGSTVSIAVAPSLAAICDGEPALITAATGFSNYVWSNGATGESITVSQTGYYSVTATDVNGCPGSSPLVEVIQSQFPIANFTYAQNSGYTVSFDNNSQNGLDFEWAFDSIGTSPLRDPTFTFPDSGPYTITLIIHNPCGSDTITKAIVVAQVGLEDLAAAGTFSVRPNPSEGDFILRTDKKTEPITSISLHDISGRMVYQSEQHLQQNVELFIPGKTLLPGTYILTIRSLQGQQFVRLIKK